MLRATAPKSKNSFTKDQAHCDAVATSSRKDVDDDESVYVQEEGENVKKTKNKNGVVSAATDNNFDDDHDTLGCMAAMFSMAKQKVRREEPEGSYLPSEQPKEMPPRRLPPWSHPYDGDDASDVMTMTSLASVLSAKRGSTKVVGATSTTTFANADAKTNIHYRSHCVRPTLKDVEDDDDHDDDHTLGNLSGIIGRVNLIEDEQGEVEQDEEAPMNTYSLRDEEEEEEEKEEETSFPKTRTRRQNFIFCFSVTFLVALTIMAVVAGVLIYYNRHWTQDGDASSTGPMSPTVDNGTESPSVTPHPSSSPTRAPSTSPTAPPTLNYMDPFIEFLQENSVFLTKDDPLQPAYMAAQWLAYEFHHQTDDGDMVDMQQLDRKLLQRYAVLVVDFTLQRPTPLPPQQQQEQEQDNDSIPAVMVKAGQELPYFLTQETIAVQDVDECDWEGIFCSNITGWVEEMRFPYQDLTGSLAAEIYLLQNSLRVLDLAGNTLHGSIPNGLYELTLLEELILYQNNLTGTLSPNIGNWNNLTKLHLSHNLISGQIPHELHSGDISRPLSTCTKLSCVQQTPSHRCCKILP
jgi:hypothetical protein